MAEPLSSMKFPDSPSSVGSKVARPAGTLNGKALPPETALPHEPLGVWPETDSVSIHDSQRYTGTGETVGNAIGMALSRARRIPGYMQEQAEELRRRFLVIRGRAAAGELPNDISDRASELKDETTRQVRLARSRAEYYAHHYPLQFIAGAAASGFLVGFLLRMWRDE